MAMKNKKKNSMKIFIAIAAVSLAVLAILVYLLVFKTDKDTDIKKADDEATYSSEVDTEEKAAEGQSEEIAKEPLEEASENASEEQAEEALDGALEEVIISDPSEVIASAEYKDGLIGRASQFKDDCALLYPDSSDDLSRFSLLDIDKDGIPELIMHDVAGKCAYYCSFAAGGVTEPFEIFRDEDNGESSFIPEAYAALYLEKNLFIKYVITGNYEKIESYIYRVNAETKAPELMNSVVVMKGSDGNKTYSDGDGNAISAEEYTAVYKNTLADDFGHYFLDELMIADGEYDFNSQYTFNSTAALSHMTLDELTGYLGQN